MHGKLETLWMTRMKWNEAEDREMTESQQLN